MTAQVNLVSDGFLGRWTKRKAQVREGLPLDEPGSPSPIRSAAVGRGGQAQAPVVARIAAVASPSPQTGEGPVPIAAPGEVPGPTLQDAQALTTESDFKPFMARGIAPEVKNAAMKKLFTDPHYNVMDRLDIYIDDYSQADPIPESMLRQMVGAQFLNLFEKTEQPEPGANGAQALTHPPQDDDTHLRLQSNNAAPAPGPGRDAE